MWVSVPLMVSLSNHRGALRQAQDERETKYVTTLKRPWDAERHDRRTEALTLC